MVLRFAQRASWLALLLNVAIVRASMYWTYTSNFGASISTDLYTYFDGDTSTYTYEYTRTVSTGVTAPATATPTSTSTTSRTYDNIEIVYAYYTTSVFAESDLVPTRDYSATSTSTTTDTMYYFYMNYTYTAPSSCPTQFTFSTTKSVDVPTEVLASITPLATVQGSATTYSDWVYEYETWYLSQDAVPVSTASDYYYTAYLANCEEPYSSSSGGSGGGYSSDYEICGIYGCTSWRGWVIIVASLIPGLFLLGFLESWFWFRRLMLGKGCLRFGTVCWVMISLWVLCFTRTQSARSQDDQKLLRERWHAMGSGQAFKLWWKWGFRHAYPVDLLGQYSRNTVGIVPAGVPLPPPGQIILPVSMGQTGPGYQGGPPPPQGAYMQPGMVPQGQPYYPPPQGWSPPPQGYGYPPPQGAMYYGEQNKEAPMVTTSPVPPPPQRSVSPLEGQPPMENQPGNVGTAQAPPATPQPMQASPINAVEAPTPTMQSSPPPNVSEAPSSPPPRPAQQ